MHTHADCAVLSARLYQYHYGICTLPTVPDSTNIRTLAVQGVPHTPSTQNEGIEDTF